MGSRLIGQNLGQVVGGEEPAEVLLPLLLDDVAAMYIQKFGIGPLHRQVIAQRPDARRSLTDNLSVMYLPEHDYVLVKTFPREITQAMVRNANFAGVMLEVSPPESARGYRS